MSLIFFIVKTRKQRSEKTKNKLINYNTKIYILKECFKILKTFIIFKIRLHKQDNNNRKFTFFEIEFTDKMENKYDYRFNMKTKKLFLNQKIFLDIYEKIQNEQKFLLSLEKW
ncbi:hypothetical protein CWO85_02580 [Candidatus Phytoplasma ziziphi]|uniref:Uncharacterized protein n=1 Tax=Ziziphus jujuba witches'-broom phytoplasma TaxID=135727 RepID=A0A660HMZ0_ZIZJU|nr:hypothetical protein CWO85_02580 [Candidatus Phytoplasma ziziphi]